MAATAQPAPTDLRADHVGALALAIGIAALLDLLVVAGRALAPGWSVSPVLPLVYVLVALMAFYRHRWTRLYRPYGGRVSIYVAEVILLLLMTRLVPLLFEPARLLASLPLWWSEPTTFFEPRFIVDALLVGMAWFAGHSLGSAVDLVHLQPGELAPPRGTPEYAQWERSEAAFDHRGARKQVVTMVASGGGLVVLALGVLGLARAGGGLLIEGLIAAGVALLCGFTLLAWSQLLLLDTLWRIDGLAMPGPLRQRWAGWLAAILLAVALVALIVPRTYAFDPLVVIFWLLQAIIGIIQVVVFLVMFPFMWLASLLGLGGGGGSPPAAMPPVLPTETRPESDLSLLALLRSLGFWLVTLALVAYSVRVLAQSRWGLGRWLPRLALLGALASWWRTLLGGLRSRVAALATLRADAAMRAAMRAARRRPARSPRPTDPRGLVQYLYLSLIDRAGQRGYPRRRGMTAAEYSRYLAARLTVPEGQTPAEAGAELDTLTAAFLEARYSRRPVGEGEVSRARQALNALLRFIRRSAPRR